MKMLRGPAVSIVSIAAALGYSSQTAFAAAYSKPSGESPSGRPRRKRWQQSRCNHGNRSGAAADPIR
ncbi:hypothetical protein [Bradyrhizobium symbiodeficiens]|uniref:hypothetical protein n=1 Tax=Bradyrhizobium symbiodeficiens TaxID=1404367 RepID=UPI003BAFF704